MRGFHVTAAYIGIEQKVTSCRDIQASGNADIRIELVHPATSTNSDKGSPYAPLPLPLHNLRPFAHRLTRDRFANLRAFRVGPRNACLTAPKSILLPI